MTCFCVMASSPPIPLYCHFFRSAVNAVGALAAAGVRAPNMKAIERSAAGVPAAGACFASCAAAVGRPPFALPSPLAAFAGAAAAGAAGALRFGAIRGGEGRGAELGPPQPWSTCEISCSEITGSKPMRTTEAGHTEKPKSGNSHFSRYQTTPK